MIAIANTVGTSILAAAYLLNDCQHTTKHRCAKIRKVQANLSTLLTCANIPEYFTIWHLCGPVPVGQMEFCCSYGPKIWLRSKFELKKVKNLDLFPSVFILFFNIPMY